jgi:hypothetical protein
MAYLSPTKLKCSNCGFSARIKIVVSVGPQTRRGDIAARNFMSPEPFTEGETEDGISSLFCPSCATLVWTNKRPTPAYGPLTEDEMRTITGLRWLVPGTENPFPPKTPPPNPDDPFSGGKVYSKPPNKRR